MIFDNYIGLTQMCICAYMHAGRNLDWMHFIVLFSPPFTYLKQGPRWNPFSLDIMEH